MNVTMSRVSLPMPGAPRKRPHAGARSQQAVPHPRSELDASGQRTGVW